MKYTNVNDLVYAVAARAKALADMPIPALRMACAENSNTMHEAKGETLGMSRGDMIEKVLLDEFIAEFPADIAE